MILRNRLNVAVVKFLFVVNLSHLRGSLAGRAVQGVYRRQRLLLIQDVSANRFASFCRYPTRLECPSRIWKKSPKFVPGAPQTVWKLYHWSFRLTRPELLDTGSSQSARQSCVSIIDRYSSTDTVLRSSKAISMYCPLDHPHISLRDLLLGHQ